MGGGRGRALARGRIVARCEHFVSWRPLNCNKQSYHVIEIEKFISEGVVHGEEELGVLFSDYSSKKSID